MRKAGEESRSLIYENPISELRATRIPGVLKRTLNLVRQQLRLTPKMTT